jgi:hypothetical protein
MMDDDEPSISDEVLIRLWHSRLPRSVIARQIGVSKEVIVQRWRELVRAGELPSRQPRSIDRRVLLGGRPIAAAPSEPPPPPPQPRPDEDELVTPAPPPVDRLLALLRFHHPEYDPALKGC